MFAPELFGPDVHGGAHILQVWRREEGLFARVHAGNGPAWSEELAGLGWW